MGGVDYDLLNDSCDACGARVAEPCAPGCVSRWREEQRVTSPSKLDGGNDVHGDA